mmetsp:Transcript_8763/g.25112  ORF Transcript_8763/g.25112 Transcript_8763/m.25112 type:complete len:166 (-) Transcript_8763:1670-2167(-)
MASTNVGGLASSAARRPTSQTTLPARRKTSVLQQTNRQTKPLPLCDDLSMLSPLLAGGGASLASINGTRGLCNVNNGGCHERATCSVSNGLVVCLCEPGYAGDDVVCEHIDECAMESGAAAGGVAEEQDKQPGELERQTADQKGGAEQARRRHHSKGSQPESVGW